ncbi:MAG: hypothetical protein C0425_06875 [Chlorobiaceae bacterium]|nr:hypothetical protein [Chlorobiaceae bacterium]MBA4310045.1 hypothetical protein [Chlorobiaceae bacterium]
MFKDLFRINYNHYVTVPLLFGVYMWRVLFFFSFLSILNGCDPSTDAGDPKLDPTGSDAKVQLANQSLEATFVFWASNSFNSAADFDRLNFKTSNTLYKEALVLNPGNNAASFGAALTEILTAYADPDINALLKKFEASGSNKALSKALFNIGLYQSTGQMQVPLTAMAENTLFMFQKAMTDPPLISEVQTVLKNKLLPRIIYAVEQLNKVAANDNFKFEVTGRMQGDQNRSSVYIYPAEVHFFTAAVNGVKMMLEQMMVYKFEMPNYSQQSLIQALDQNGTTFFALAADGTSRAANAKSAMNEMINKFISGVQKLETISGRKTDAIIKIGNDGMKQQDIDTLKVYLQKMKSAITSPVSIFVENGDRDGNSYTIQVNLSRLFDNPVANPKKSFIPTYQVLAVGTKDIQIKFAAETYAQFTFPDPTFNGLFPGMTNSNLKKLLRIDEAFAFRLEGSINSGNQPLLYLPKLRLVTAAKTYEVTAKKYGSGFYAWYEYEFFIPDVNNVSYTFFVDYGSGYEEFIANEPLIIKTKQHLWKEIKIDFPSGLQYYLNSNPWSIDLFWQGSYTSSVVQKATGGGNFVDHMPMSYSNYYRDNFITQGTTYRYRIRTSTVAQNDQFVPKNPKYSNIVTVNP